MSRRLIALFLCFSMLAALFVGCAKQSPADASADDTVTQEPSAEPAVEPEPVEAEFALERESGCNQLTIYWSREGVDYSKSDVWVWFENQEGRGYEFHPCGDGVKCVVNVPAAVTRVGFLVRYDCSNPCGTSWGTATKDFEQDRFVTMDGDVAIRLQAGDETVYYLDGYAAGSAGGNTATAFTPAGFANEAVIGDVTFTSSYETDDNNRVFYEIFVGAFSDSNGDGIGDLRGIINRFDYLNDGNPQSGKSLGIEGIWLMPIFESPSYHKYDVTDYYSIDPAYGTLEDLQELAALCSQRNVKLIIDLPINHTGSRCAWFTEFVKAHKQGDTESPYYNFYSWYTEGERPASNGSYSPITGTSDYYESNFDSSMPELNFDNEAVREEVLHIAEYWMEQGVDGFRFDASKYVYFGDNNSSAAFWEWYCGTLRSEYPDIYVVHEVWDSDALTYPYNTSGSCFDFTVSGAEGLIAEIAKKGDVNRYTRYVQSYLGRIAEKGDNALYTPFISNHDMDRAAGFLTVASYQMQMGANLYILGPGSPFIYYGEELGMKGTRGSSGTDANRRLAMLWGDGDPVQDPEGTTYDPAKQTNGYAVDEVSADWSLYNYYKRLIMIRKANPEIARGEYQALTLTGTKVGGFLSTWNGSTVLVLHNTSGSAATIDLAAATGASGWKINAYIGVGTASLNGDTLTLEGQTSVVLR